VRWLGALPGPEWLAAVAGARVFLNASRIEDWGLAQMEALAAGVPLVTVPAPGGNPSLAMARELDARLVAPERTAAALADGWFHTGDGGSLDDEHYLTISDRKKDVIISGGENVSSIEVEDCLFSHPGVAEVAVIGVPDERWGETVKALVVLAPDAQVSEEDLTEHCRERLAHYKCPTSVEVRNELTRTATGKLQKFKLREPYWEDRDRQI